MDMPLPHHTLSSRRRSRRARRRTGGAARLARRIAGERRRRRGRDRRRRRLRAEGSGRHRDVCRRVCRRADGRRDRGFALLVHRERSLGALHACALSAQRIERTRDSILFLASTARVLCFFFRGRRALTNSADGSSSKRVKRPERPVGQQQNKRASSGFRPRALGWRDCCEEPVSDIDQLLVRAA